MGSVIQLKNKVNNAYLDLKNSVDDKIILVEEKIKNKLISDVSLLEKMTSYNLETGGKKLRTDKERKITLLFIFFEVSHKNNPNNPTK